MHCWLLCTQTVICWWITLHALAIDSIELVHRLWCSDWFPVGASCRDGCEEECEQPKPVSSARPTECVRDVRIPKNGWGLWDWWDCARCEDQHRKRWMFVGLVGSDGTITIALFIKYLLGFIMRERRMTVSYLFFLHCIVHFLCIGVSTIGAICTKRILLMLVSRNCIINRQNNLEYHQKM